MLSSKIDGKQISYPQLRGTVASIKYPALAEIKMDGELNYIRIDDDDKPYTINKYGTMRADFPALNDIAENLKDEGIDTATILCELYWDEGKLGALYELLSKKKDDGVKLSVFDMIEVNGECIRNQSLLDRKEMMSELKLGAWTPKCWVVEDKDEMQARFEETMTMGFEGIVVKDLESKFVQGPCSWVKMKYKDQNDCAVSMIDPVKERIEIMYMSPDPTSSTNTGVRMVPVGVKAPNSYKKHIKVGDIVTIEHQGVLTSGSLRHPVLIAKKEWK